MIKTRKKAPLSFGLAGILPTFRRASDGTSYACEGCNRKCETHWGGPVYAYPAAWGTMFAPNDRIDQDWIRNNCDLVADLGFIAPVTAPKRASKRKVSGKAKRKAKPAAKGGKRR